MKRIILIFVLVIALALFVSKETKYSEMENFRIQATIHKKIENNYKNYGKNLSCNTTKPKRMKKVDKNF